MIKWFEMFERLQPYQAKLDAHIIEEHNLDPDTIDYELSMGIARAVEMGELANEIRCFKLWSKNQKPTDKVLDEYVDVLHFMLGRSNYLKECFGSKYNVVELFEKTSKVSSWTVSRSITLTLFYLFNFKLDEMNVKEFIRGELECFLHLGNLLNFTPEQVEKAYHTKNKINYERQQNNY